MENATLILTSAVLNSFLRGRHPHLPERHCLSTTGIIAHGLRERCHNMTIKEFSPSEMEEFMKFRASHRDLMSIGFMDSSAVYYSSTSKFPLIIDDSLTACVCSRLGVRFMLPGDLCDRDGTLHQPTALKSIHSAESRRGKENVPESPPIALADGNLPLKTG